MRGGTLRQIATQGQSRARAVAGPALRRLLTSLLVLLAVLHVDPWMPLAASGRDAQVMLVHDLAAVARDARARRLPIALVVSMDHCPYCVRLEEDFLRPMLISGDYTDRVIICKLDLDSYQRVRDFQGRETTGRDLAGRYGVRLAPTVLLLDPQGEELAPRLVGLTTPDFYGGYLDAAIDESVSKLRGDSSG